EAASAALASVGGADLAILFATPGYPEGVERLLAAAVDVLGTSAVVGASAHGVLGAGIECENRASVSVMALAGVEAEPFLIRDVRGDEPQIGAEIAARIPGGPRPEDLVVALPDPRLDSAALVHGLDSALRPAQVVGAGAGDPFANAPAQWLGGDIETGSVAGVVLRGSGVRIGVTQACRPTTEPLAITRAQGNWILELDGRPALDVYREAALGPLADDLQRAAAFVLVALPSDREASLLPGSYRVRHVVGFSPDERAFALPETVERGQQIALAVREPESARADLKAMLAEFEGAQPAFGLYFNCCARGSAFFGIPGLEAAYLESALPETPIAGMFGSHELGPIGVSEESSVELLTYTGVLALLEG
ncbi:MAG: FIST C-terminal domain-containing protein, partial [Deltaproteobacteria bacterium]|nr:FIST C-terminal domain-containing protein [Deltaproteobacteria bacterium]